VSAVLLGVFGFVAMEAVSYATHRWVMHGLGMVWHRSHHLPASPGWEANDLFPVLFSFIGFGAFVAAGWLPGCGWMFPVAVGITVYGAAYLFVHEVYIHERLPLRVPPNRYLEWVRDSHWLHHRFGGEPYGMLLPVIPKSLRERAAASPRPDEVRPARSSVRVTRSRL
jgi:beta-carotene 3-hydroxylase